MLSREQLPNGLDKDAVFNRVRRSRRVWIVRPGNEPNVLDLYSEDLNNIKRAVQDINWLIVKMIMQSKQTPDRYFLQWPIDPQTADLVGIAGLRPSVRHGDGSLEPAEYELKPDFSSLDGDLPLAVATLHDEQESLKMRVNFGHLQLRQKKSGMADEISFPDFEKLMGLYARRGGAGFEPR